MSRVRFETLGELLTEENIASEVWFFEDPNHRSLERPYGWGWLLTLHGELATWDDPDARRWARALEPLADLLTTNLVGWLPRPTYPQRVGVHPNTAFGLSRSYGHAERRDARRRGVAGGHPGGRGPLVCRRRGLPGALRAVRGGFPLRGALRGRADVARPGAVRVPRLAGAVPAGHRRGQARGAVPAEVSDPTDGQIAHLHGLNLSRAWAFVALAARLTAGDARIAPMLAAAERHAEASLPYVAGSDYMVEHWLAAYATLLLSS